MQNVAQEQLLVGMAADEKFKEEAVEEWAKEENTAEVELFWAWYWKDVPGTVFREESKA